MSRVIAPAWVNRKHRGRGRPHVEARRLRRGFRPSDIEGLEAHYAAREIEGLSNGDPVEIWRDLTGNGHNFSAFDSGDLPTYQTNVLNGHPVVDFTATGEDPMLFAPSLAQVVDGTDRPISIVIVFQIEAQASNQAVFCFNRTSSSNPFAEIFHLDGSDALRWGRRDTGATFLGVTETTGSSDDGTWHIFTVLDSGTSAQLRTDGAANGSGSVDVGEVAVDTCVLGAEVRGETDVNLPGEDAKMQVAELMVYSVELTTPQAVALEGFVDNFYAIL